MATKKRKSAAKKRAPKKSKKSAERETASVTHTDSGALHDYARHREQAR